MDKLPFMSCFRPLKIWTSPSQPTLVPCGKCYACLNRKRSSLALKLHLEENSSKYCYLITLTYDNAHLPLFRLDETDYEDYLLPVPISDRIVSDGVISYDQKHSNDLKFFSDETLLIRKCDTLYTSIRCYNHQVEVYEKMHSRVVGYGHGTFALLYYRDVQLWLKRFRKKIFKDYGEKVRYYVIGEYGTESLRPHWHCLLFFESDSLAQTLEDVQSVGTRVRPCECAKYLLPLWKYGICESKRTDRNSYSYVSSYVSKPASFPEVLDALSPQKAYHSIGLGEVLPQKDVLGFIKDKDFASLRFHSVCNSDGSLSDYSLWRSYYDKFFPRYSGQSSQDYETTLEVFKSYERLASYFCTDSVSLIASKLFRLWNKRVHTPTLDNFYNIFNVQLFMCVHSDLNVLSALCSAVRASKKVQLYANTLGITTSAYLDIYRSWYSFVDLSTLNEHFATCERNEVYSKLYYDTMVIRSDGSSYPCDYWSGDTDPLFACMVHYECQKYSHSIKHREKVALIQSSLNYI